VLLPIDAAALSIQLALYSRPLTRSEFTAGLTGARFIQPDLRLVPSYSRRLCSRQLTALNALPNSISLIILAFVYRVIGDAVLGVMFLLIDVLARSIQLMLDSLSLLRSEFTAGLTRSGFIQLDLRFPPLYSRRLDPRQLAAANALPDPLLLIPLAFVDTVPSPLSQASRRNYDRHQRRHHKPFHEPLLHLYPPWAASSGGNP